MQRVACVDTCWRLGQDEMLTLFANARLAAYREDGLWATRGSGSVRQPASRTLLS